MKRVIIIGLGTIAHHHLAALRAVEGVEIVGLCDLQPEAAKQPQFANYDFDTHLERLIGRVHPDTAIILTPPNSHRAIAEQCIHLGLHAVIEKPLEDCERDVEYLLQPQVAKHWTPVYHSICGPEVQWWLKHMGEVPVESLRIAFSDPYATKKGHIHLPKRVLGGTWIDSGVNALALVALLAPIKDMREAQAVHFTDPDSGLYYQSDFMARCGRIEVEIAIRWNENINHKETIIRANGKTYRLNHSAQSVECEGEILFQDNSCQRLTAQYTAFYQHFPNMTLTMAQTKAIYKILFENL